MQIPKIIHQSWKNKNVPTNLYRHEWIDSWKIKNPQYEYIFWTDEDNAKLVRQHYPEFYEFYQQIPRGVQKADFCRFLYLYHYGGLYVDLDFVCLKPVHQIVSEGRVVLGRMSGIDDYYSIPNAFMAGISEDSFWYETAQLATRNSTQDQQIEALAGPIHLENCISLLNPSELVVHDQVVLYPIDWRQVGEWKDNKYLDIKAKALFDQLKRSTVNQMEVLLPDSHAVTLWAHGWD